MASITETAKTVEVVMKTAREKSLLKEFKASPLDNQTLKH